MVAQWLVLSLHIKKDLGPSSVEFICSPCVCVSCGCSGFLTQYKDMQVTCSGNSRLPAGVKCECVCLFICLSSVAD